MTRQKRTDQFIEECRGRDNEFSLLYGVVLAWTDLEWERRVAFESIFDVPRIAERLEEIKKNRAGRDS